MWVAIASLELNQSMSALVLHALVMHNTATGSVGENETDKGSRQAAAPLPPHAPAPG